MSEPNWDPAPAAEVTFASPLSLLLAEEQAGDRQAEQLLLLSYTTDLAFFETTVLGVAHATGAAVSVVGDAAMTSVNPRAVRRAGRSYLSGLAHLSGAFHPKLLLLAGRDRATVAIGSGNATLAGWQSNAELWTVLRGSRTDGCPAAFSELGAWLRALPDVVRTGPGVRDALARAAAVLLDLAAAAPATAPRVRLGTNLTRPLIELLPAGPVQQLNLYAPFHDRDGRAIRELLDRLQPTSWSLAWQPGQTDLEPAVVEQLLAERSGRLSTESETRYRHGKLIEWVASDGSRAALVGSANLSGPALLDTAAGGGNVELGLLLPVAATLMPPATAEQPAAVLRTAPPVPRVFRPAGPLLLGAVRVAEGLEVQLAHPLREPAVLQLSQASMPPELWEQIAVAEPGEVQLLLPTAAEAGSRVRLVADVDGVPRPGNTVFVLDPVRAASRPGAGAPRTRSTTPDELFTDPAEAERFAADLAALRAALPTAPSAPAAAGSRSADATVTSDLGWQRYLDEAAGRLGMPLLRFALGLPDSPETEPLDVAPVSWVEDLTDDALLATDDDSADAVADDDRTSVRVTERVADLGRAPDAVRRRYRRWAERLTEVTPVLALPERLLGVRLLLRLVAARAWPYGDTAWVPLLADVTESLGTATVPPYAEPQTGSLAALAVSVLRREADGLATSAETLAFRRARSAVAHLLPSATAERLEVYAEQLGAAFGPAADPELVLVLAEEVVQNDPVAAAVHILEDRGRSAHRHEGAVLHVVDDVRAPARIGIEAVVAADTDLVAAWVGGAATRWALVMWRRPDMVFVERTGPMPVWRHLRIPARLSPATVLTTEGIDRRFEVRHIPLSQPPSLAPELMAQLGVPSTEPPQCQPG